MGVLIRGADLRIDANYDKASSILPETRLLRDSYAIRHASRVLHYSTVLRLCPGIVHRVASSFVLEVGFWGGDRGLRVRIVRYSRCTCSVWHASSVVSAAVRLPSLGLVPGALESKTSETVFT